jgi:transposase
LTTKIHMLADSRGRPLRFILTGGQVHDIIAAPMLLDNIQGGGVIADKAYDANDFRQLIADAGMRAVIPSRRSRKVQIPHDAILYKTRNRIERCFNKLKHFRRFATRFDRRAKHFLAFIHLAAAMIWMR